MADVPCRNWSDTKSKSKIAMSELISCTNSMPSTTSVLETRELSEFIITMPKCTWFVASWCRHKQQSSLHDDGQKADKKHLVFGLGVCQNCEVLARYYL